MGKAYVRIRIRTWIGIKMESRIRIGIITLIFEQENISSS
jgi:hypothetical protein